ncbi:MAG: hypothetical protein AABX73_03280 [Nanoarchaeota archaeon]
MAEETKPEEHAKEKKLVNRKAKKKEAIARGASLPISKKHSIYLCRFIKNKDINSAIKKLEGVSKFKEAVPFKGEIPHRKGMMSGRYPINASIQFISLLKGLRGNSITNGLDLEKTRIYFASATWASRPARSGGRHAKRTNVILKAKEFVAKEEL